MNQEKIATMQYKKVRIRPIARRIEQTGHELSPIDDWWQIESSSDEKLRLVNPRTSHFITLGVDHIKEYRTDLDGGSDGFLVLKSQVILKGTGVCVEPLVFGGYETSQSSLRDTPIEVGKITMQADFANDDTFWRAFIEKATQTQKAEPQLWDCKETLTMWHVKKEPERGRARVTFCEDVACFANARGGVLIVGVSDKREIVGIRSGHELESRLKFAADVLAEQLDYPRDITRLQQIVMPVKDGTDKVCLVVVIAQASEPVGVHDGAGQHTYPVRRETGLTRVARSDIVRSKTDVKSDNQDFLSELYKFVHSPVAERSPARLWPEQLGGYVATSSEAIPAFPSELSGYRFEAGKDFWGKPFSEKGTIRVFQRSGWQGIPKFPATMNGCSSGVFMIRWRSAHPETPVESSLRSYNALVEVDTKPAQGFGYMSGTNCEQPMFKFPDEPNRYGATLVDVYYELKFWQAAP
jgi:hypothetical protein